MERLSSKEMSTADLLKMSADELADPTTKGKRLAARDEMTKSSIVENTEETLEAKRRQAMSSGEEIWRNRQDSVSRINIAAPSEASFSVDNSDMDQLETLDDKKRALDTPYSEWHDSAIAPPRKVTRQSSDDSGTGFVANDPDAFRPMPAEPPSVGFASEKTSIPKPKVVKPPSVLDLIRSSSIERSATMPTGTAPSAAASRSLDDRVITTVEHTAFNAEQGKETVASHEDDEVVIPASAMVRSGPFYHCSPRMLLNSEAETEITVSFPSMNIPKFSFTGIVTDKY